jgi:hypothetical protein
VDPRQSNIVIVGEIITTALDDVTRSHAVREIGWCTMTMSFTPIRSRHQDHRAQSPDIAQASTKR